LHFVVLQEPVTPQEGPLADARRLILAQGWNATAYQILNPGIDLWFSKARDAVAGYRDWGGIRVVAGAPICAHARLAAVARELEESAAARGRRLCYFAAGTRLESLLSARGGHAQAVIGAQPCWDPSARDDLIGHHASLRAQLHRARNKGVTVRERPSAEAGADPGIEACLKEWLAGRNMPPMGFLVEPRTLPRLWDRRIFVAERQGRPVAFLVAAPVPVRNGWLIEQIVRGRHAPNGTAETLVEAAYRTAHAEGLRYFTLGLAPLSQVLDGHPGGGGAITESNPLWLDLAFSWLRAHGSRFYDFQGLERFKAKFRPMEWEPIYALSRGPMSLRVLLAIAAAFAGGSPFTFLAGALGRALRQEATWFAERMLLRKGREEE
jgi:phosphatidylglycerol lysyltransferase